MKPLNSYDKKGILAEEVFVEIFEQEDAIRRAQMLLSFQDRAKELGVKGQFDTMVKAFEKAEKETQQKQRQSQTLIENWTNFTGKYDSMKCGSWLAADNGIRTFNKDYSNEVIVCYHPIMPIGRMRNLETGEEQIRLAYKRNHRWTEIAVPKDIISSASKIVSLSKLGVAVTSENAKLLVKYLSDVENMNDDEIPIQRSSAKLGWIGDGFLPYDTEIIFDGDAAVLAETYDKDFFAALLAGTKLLIGSSSAKKKVTAASAYDYIVDLGTMLSKKKVPKVNRFVTVNADYLGLLSKDKRFTANPKVLENGVVEGQTINGMQVMCSEELPANVIIANHKSAIGAAKQINEVEAMRLQNKFADGIRGLCVYGDKVLRDDASAALYFEVGTAADADPINVKITNDTKSPVNTKEVSA